MPESAAGIWGAINGEEFTNAQRTISYVKNYGLPITINDCWCSNIAELLNCDGASGFTPYYLPQSDPAPWYDSSIPESGAFLGFLTTEFDGMGSTFTRNTFETLTNGAVLGRLRAQARTLTWKGYLFGVNCCGAEYGIKWLTSQLSGAGGCSGCDGGELDIMTCCPEILECADCEPSTDQGIGPASDAFRTFYRVGLVDGPKILSRREVGCGVGCNGAGTCGNCQGCLIEVEFSIVAGNPYMHKDPVVVCTDQKFPNCDTGLCTPNSPWKKIETSFYPANSKDGQTCLDSLDCSVLEAAANCIEDPECKQADLPGISPITDDCGCEPIVKTRICCSVDDSVYGKFFEGVPSIDIFGGKTLGLRNVIVSFYENPQERTCADEAIFESDCFKCASVNIRYIPPNTTLTVDGLTRRITAKCVGRDPVPAESLTVSPFRWPTLKCIPYIITVEADCFFTIPTDASVTFTVIPREM